MTDTDNIGSATGMILGTVCCLLFFGLPLPIIAVSIAVDQAQNVCQQTDSLGLNLSQWLLGSGIAGLVSVLALVTLIIMACWCKAETIMIGMLATTILVSLFNFVYSIIGAIVLFRSNSACLNQGTDLGVCALIVLIFYWLSILFRLCHRPSANTQ